MLGVLIFPQFLSVNSSASMHSGDELRVMSCIFFRSSLHGGVQQMCCRLGRNLSPFPDDRVARKRLQAARHGGNLSVELVPSMVEL